MIALKDPATKRRLSDVFLEKPPPQTFPDYYEIIEKPVAISDILRKSRSETYVVLQEFCDDWKLMFANARKFNRDDQQRTVKTVSTIYRDNPLEECFNILCC